MSFDPTKVIKMGKGHSLGYHGRDTHFCSISRSKILEPEYSLATCVSTQRWQYRNCLCRIAKRAVLAFPCFSYREAVDLMGITWNTPVMVSLSLAVEHIAVSSNIQPLQQKLWISKEQLKNRMVRKCWTYINIIEQKNTG